MDSNGLKRTIWLFPVNDHLKPLINITIEIAQFM